MNNTYQDRVDRLNVDLDAQQKKSNQITWLRSIIFLIFAWGLYAQFQMDFGRFFWLVPLVLFFVFLKFVGISGEIKQKVKLLKQLVAINKTEINYLNHQLDGLDNGKSYQDANHFFAYDLDVFGEASLFQYLNRTSTIAGKNELAKNISEICENKNIIEPTE